MDNYSSLLFIILMGVAFYFLLIRPQRKRQQAQLQTLRSLTPGTRVLLGSGVFGTIVQVGNKQAVLELSPGVHITVLKQAIVRVANPDDEDNPESFSGETAAGETPGVEQSGSGPLANPENPDEPPAVRKA